MLKLERDFRELNRFSLNMEYVIDKLYNDYYVKGGKFPYNIFDYYVNKYNSVYRLMYKRKESFVNKSLGSISNNYKEMLNRCNVRSSKEILRGVCLKYSAVIKKDVYKYIPIDEESRNRIYYRLFPIIEGLDITDIVNLYDYFVEYVVMNKDDIIDELYHLQRLFVSFIYIILDMEPANNFRFEYITSRLTYDEVCELILCEKVISNINVDSESIKVKKYS